MDQFVRRKAQLCLSVRQSDEAACFDSVVTKENNLNVKSITFNLGFCWFETSRLPDKPVTALRSTPEGNSEQAD